ncbi:MAG: ribosome biogenesis GTPase YlqF, partial [Clostridia bacterium]|nr:ribosome biogenesis GTPase YlqF [Clostridia bacterium]
PGHMTRTRRKMQQSLKLVDMVVEVVDARVPLASRNPELSSIVGGKPRLVVLNKCDIADENATRRWIADYRARGVAAIAVDCKTGRGVNAFAGAICEVMADKLAAMEKKGLRRPIRAMVAGVPNTGKSSFINRMTAGSKAKTEDRPGVTRENKWFTLKDGTLLMDTPGILWPKFEDQQVARHLAYTGAIRDQILDVEELAWGLLKLLMQEYYLLLAARYKLAETPETEDAWELLQIIGRKRRMLVSGGEIDTERAAIMLLDEFRGGKIGRITLEWPEVTR